VPVIESVADGVILTVRVIPRAAKAGVAGMRDDALLVRLNAPPVEGAANAELIDVLSSLLKISHRRISLLSGGHSRRKRLRIDGVDARTVSTALAITIS
jgi:uncharacterized protein (TIGR00251 family)